MRRITFLILQLPLAPCRRKSVVWPPMSAQLPTESHDTENANSVLCVMTHSERRDAGASPMAEEGS